MDRQRGFTLIELMMVIAVAGILLVIGVPALQDMVRNNRLVTAANHLVAHLNLARSEVIKRGGGVGVVCSTSEPSQATPACNGGSNWSTGNVVRWTEDANQSGSLDSGEDVDGDGSLDTMVLRVTGSAGGGVTITGGGGGMIVFGPTGALLAGGLVGICDGRGGEKGRQITISGTGRPQIQHGRPGQPVNCTPP